jgi:signal transduction histidine kinase
MLGAAPDDREGARADEALVEADGRGVLARALGGDEVGGASTVLRRRDGAEVPVRLDARPDGETTLLVLHDDSERVETQAALAEAREQLRDLQRLGDVGIWRWLPEIDQVEWSEHLYRIHDLDPLQFPHNLAGHLAPVREDQREEIAAALHAAVDPGTPFEAEYVIVRGDGEPRWVYSRATAMHDDHGRVVALTGVVQDVTADRRARAEIQEINARLERFASVLAHDLREPLVAIDGFAELLVGRAELEGDAALFAERIRVNSRRAVDLLSEILADARSGGRAPMGEVELTDVVDWVLDALAERIDRTGASVTTGHLPRVAGNEGLLRQALLNLVSNALKFRRGDAGARIHITAVEDDAMVELRVDDDGPGVPEEEREAVFDEGFRGRREIDRGSDGTGIGLATVAEIAHRHGGAVTVGDSDLGGARLALRLPITSSDAGRGSM